jgi:hypothetical protein
MQCLHNQLIAKSYFEFLNLRAARFLFLNARFASHQTANLSREHAVKDSLSSANHDSTWQHAQGCAMLRIAGS